MSQPNFAALADKFNAEADAVSSMDDYRRLRARWLGKNGIVRYLLFSIGKWPANRREVAARVDEWIGGVEGA